MEKSSKQIALIVLGILVAMMILVSHLVSHEIPDLNSYADLSLPQYQGLLIKMTKW